MVALNRGAATSAQASADCEAFRFWAEEKLRNMDTDRFGHVNNSVIATFLEAGRIEIFGSPCLQVLMEGLNVVVARLLTNFHQELFYPGTVRIGTSVRRIGNTSFEVDQVVIGAHGRVASAEATCVLIDEKTRKPRSIPDPLRGYLLDADPSAVSHAPDFQGGGS